MSNPNIQDQDLRIELVTNPSDFTAFHHIVKQSFGIQAADGLWLALYPDYETDTATARGIANFTKQYEQVTKNKNGDPNTVFLKATLPSENQNEERRVVGMTIWKQCSFVAGHGDSPSDLPGDLSHLPPSDQRFTQQAFASLWKRRIEYTREKENADPPAIFVLDMCAVHPAFQKRGIASKLVEWGLEEAKRRGGLECTTEASSMGRTVYTRLGFKAEGEGDLVYEVDEEFRWRSMPPNVFLRTGVVEK